MPMEDLIKFGYSNLVSKSNVKSLNHVWKPQPKFMLIEKCGFPCGSWAQSLLLGWLSFQCSIALLTSRNKHFQHDKEWQKQIATYLKKHGKEAPAVKQRFDGAGCKAVGC